MFITIEIKHYAYVTSITKLLFQTITIKIDVLVPPVNEHRNTLEEHGTKSIAFKPKKMTLSNIWTFHGQFYELLAMGDELP